METIDQDPNDIVLREPIQSKQSPLFKITTFIFAATTIIFGAIAFFNSNKPSEGRKDSSKSDASQTSSDSNSGDSKVSEDGLALKNFDVNIGKLVGAAGFNYGSILSIKTNADGTYMIGEVKNGDITKFAYRSLPKGDWEKSNLATEPFDKDNNWGTDCKEIAKEVLELFKDYKTSGGKDAYCLYNPTPEEVAEQIKEETGRDVDPERLGYDGDMVTASEALKKGLFKSE
jgi:hypothetical protein